MKKLSNILVAIALSVVTFSLTSCKKDEDTTPQKSLVLEKQIILYDITDPNNLFASESETPIFFDTDKMRSVTFNDITENSQKDKNVALGISFTDNNFVFIQSTKTYEESYKSSYGDLTNKLEFLNETKFVLTALSSEDFDQLEASGDIEAVEKEFINNEDSAENSISFAAKSVIAFETASGEKGLIEMVSSNIDNRLAIINVLLVKK